MKDKTLASYVIFIYQLGLEYFIGLLRFNIFLILGLVLLSIFFSTPLEKSIIIFLSVLPGTRIGEIGSFQLDNSNIWIVYFFFGLLTSILFRFLRIFGSSFLNGQKYVWLLGIILHGLALGVFTFRISFQFAFFLFGLLLFIFVMSMIFLIILQWLFNLVEVGKSKNPVYEKLMGGNLERKRKI